MAQKMGDREFKGDAYSREMERAIQEQKKLAGGVSDALINPLAPAMAVPAGIGKFAASAYKNGLPYAAGQAYNTLVGKTTDAMEFAGNLGGNILDEQRRGREVLAKGTGKVGQAAREVADIYKGAAQQGVKKFKQGAGRNTIDPTPVDPTQDPATIDAQFAEGEEQLAGLPSLPLQEAPISADGTPTPEGITKLDIGGDSPIFKNVNLTPEEQEKYGKAIYSDTGVGATAEGFEATRGGISEIETSGDLYEDQESPRNQAMNLLKTMPYGTPGDRQKRRDILDTANSLLGIGQQDFSQAEAGRQYGLDVYKAQKPASQVGRYKNIAGEDITDEYGDVIGKSEDLILDSSTGQFVPKEQPKKRTAPPELRELFAEFEAGEQTPERKKEYERRAEELMQTLSGQ